MPLTENNLRALVEQLTAERQKAEMEQAHLAQKWGNAFVEWMFVRFGGKNISNQAREYLDEKARVQNDMPNMK